MNVEEYKRISKSSGRKNKYNAKKTEYNGVLYDSKKEAQFARDLDLAKHAKNIKERVISWERQVPYKFVYEGRYIFTYKLDFRVHYANNIVKNYDVKGYKKGSAYALFRLKKKLVQAQHTIVIDEI